MTSVARNVPHDEFVRSILTASGPNYSSPPAGFWRRMRVGVKGGMTYGETDEFGFRAVQDRVHIHDLHATILHLLGIDHERLTYRYAGRDFRLTDVEGRAVNEILT